MCMKTGGWLSLLQATTPLLWKLPARKSEQGRRVFSWSRQNIFATFLLALWYWKWLDSNLKSLGTERPELGRRVFCQSRQKIFDSQVILCLCSCAAPYHIGENSSNVESLGAEREEHDRSPIWSLGSTSCVFLMISQKKTLVFLKISKLCSFFV